MFSFLLAHIFILFVACVLCVVPGVAMCSFALVSDGGAGGGGGGVRICRDTQSPTAFCL